MQFQRFDLRTCAEATGTAVVIDVLRAFTTAAFAFHQGAAQITLVGAVQEALDLRQQNPDLLLMGEAGGLPMDGFDFGNSPARIQTADLTGRHLVQRTSAGTQGVVRATRADVLLTSSFVCAQATAVYLQQLTPSTISFIVTGAHGDELAEEDVALADYLEALLTDQSPDPGLYLERVRQSKNGRLFASSNHPDFPPADLDCATDLDRFNFAMIVAQHEGAHLLRPHYVF